MRILTPFLSAFAEESVALGWARGTSPLGSTSIEVNLSGIPPNEPFWISVGGTKLFETTREQLQILAKRIAVVDILMCLDHVDFRPVMNTNVFYRNDPQIVVLTRYRGVTYDCPIIISWWSGGELLYGNLVIVPPASGQDGGTRAHAHGVCITPDVRKGEWLVTYQLLTGEEILRSRAVVLDRDRGDYGQPCSARHRRYTK